METFYVEISWPLTRIEKANALPVSITGKLKPTVSLQASTEGRRDALSVFHEELLAEAQSSGLAKSSADDKTALSCELRD